MLIRTEACSVAHVPLSFHVAGSLVAAFFILAQPGCSSDGGVDQVVKPVEPAVATILTSATTVTLRATAGSPVLPPSVLVRDQRHAVMPGVAVTFAIASGGGTVTGGSVTTNALGIATVGSWILGETPGLNTLTASVTGLSPVTFAATGVPRPTPNCVPVTMAHELGTTTNEALGGADCLSDAVYTDLYSTTLSSVGAYVFKVSATFDAYLYLGTPDFFRDFEGLIADNNNESSASTNSAIKALLPAGSYQLGVSSANFGATGAYSLSSAAASAEISGCEEVYIVRGVSSIQNVQTTDCERTTAPVYADEFLIYVSPSTAGSPLTLSMSSTTVDSFLQLLRVDPGTGVRTVVASNDNADTSGTKDARLVYTPVTGAYYVIVASTALPGQTGGYALAVQ